MRQTELRLSSADRTAAAAVRAKGSCSARQVNRAHILLALDRGIPESQIMAVLGVGRMMVWRTRTAYLDGGLDLAIRDVHRSGRPPKYDTQTEARLTALACSDAPEGATRWTLQSLHEAIRKEPGLGSIGRETVRRLLKKTASNPGAR
jgi:putative transposase